MNISVALITYLRLKHFSGNMKVLLGHLNWELGTGGSRSGPKWLAEYLGLTLVFVSNGAQRWRFNIHFSGVFS